MVMLEKKSILLAKAETTYGTDPTPAAATDSIYVRNLKVKEVQAPIERDVHWAFLGQLPSIKGEQYAEVTWDMDLYGSGSVALAPRIGCVLLACGTAATISSGVSVTYTPTSTSIGSVTLYVYKDGRQHIVTGARGTFKLKFEAGKCLVASFTMNGKYTAPTTVANPTCTYETSGKLPPVCKSSTFTYNAKTTLVLASVEFDAGNTVAKRPSLNDATGIAGYEITERKPTAILDPEAQVETSYTLRTDQLTTTRAISVLATRAAGNIITLNAAQYNITDVEYDERDGILVEKITGECSESSGNDGYTIVFT